MDCCATLAPLARKRTLIQPHVYHALRDMFRPKEVVFNAQVENSLATTECSAIRALLENLLRA